MTNSDLNLNAKTRIKEKETPKKLRKDGYVPAVLYGYETNNQHLKIPVQEMERIYNEAGESQLVDLSIDGKESVKILIKDIQTDFIKDKFLHVDFYQVKMGQEMTAEIPLTFIGESKAIKELGGFLVKNMESVEISCLPRNLPSEIEVDISQLNDFGDQIKMNDLKLPQGVELISETDDVVAIIEEPREEEEEEVTAEEGGEEAAKEEESESGGGEERSK
jgi:large subunit ribosomal protein L25